MAGYKSISDWLNRVSGFDPPQVETTGGGGGDASAANQTTLNTLTGAANETAPVSDTASSGLNGRLQRIAQRLSSLIALLPAAFGAGGGVKVDGSGTALPVSASTLPLPTGAATSALQGAADETAPVSDTASSGLNGRLQRIAQRLSSLIALLPAAFGAGGGVKIDGSGTALPVTTELVNGSGATADWILAQIGNGFVPADEISNDANGLPNSSSDTLPLMVFPALFNGSTWDLPRNNIDITLMNSAARTTAQTGAPKTNHNARGVVVVIDVTAKSSTPSLTFSIVFDDGTSGKAITILSSAAITDIGTYTLTVYPGITPVANVAADMPLPRSWHVDVAVADADSCTYSVGANYIN